MTYGIWGIATTAGRGIIPHPQKEVFHTLELGETLKAVLIDQQLITTIHISFSVARNAFRVNLAHYCSVDPNPTPDSWSKIGFIKTRTDGPADLSCEVDKKSIIKIIDQTDWRIIEKIALQGFVSREVWILNDLYHRLDGPALRDVFRDQVKWAVNGTPLLNWHYFNAHEITTKIIVQSVEKEPYWAPYYIAIGLALKVIDDKVADALSCATAIT